MTALEKLHAAIGVVAIFAEIEGKSETELAAYEAALKVVKDSFA